MNLKLPLVLLDCVGPLKKGQVPSGIPYPDSTFRIHQASREYTRALQSVQSALVKMNDYLAHGKIPPELEGLGSKPPTKEAHDPTKKAG